MLYQQRYRDPRVQETANGPEAIDTAATETVSGHRNGVDFDRKYVFAAVEKAREMMKLPAM